MRIYDVIEKKKKGEALSESQIHDVINGYVSGDIADYQMSALLMAICLRGMNKSETASLTDAMAKSGEMIPMDRFGSRSVDKHSTGGVGDKTTLIVAPIAAAAGCTVAKMSGRGLGHTGGTVDKLESIPGFNATLEAEEFSRIVNECSLSVTAQSADLAPADKLIYALRDATATVDSIPLIASSIMSKKLAAGTRSIVLDVKFGRGAFMKTPEDAEALAREMIDIGVAHGRRMAALISSMDEPLGDAVGNSLEVMEAIEVLKDGKEGELKEVSLTLAALMIELSLGISDTEARRIANDTLQSGAAYAKFCEWLRLQGADLSFVENPEALKPAPHSVSFSLPESGYINKTDALLIGMAAMALGAGREKKEDKIDFGAGIIMHKGVGDAVLCGEPIATLYTSDERRFTEAKRLLACAVTLGKERPLAKKKIHNLIKK